LSLLELGLEVFDACINLQCAGDPCRVLTDSFTYREKCAAEAAAASACEILC